MSQNPHIFYDESSYIIDEMYDKIKAIMHPTSRKSFYRRHELAIWATIVITLGLFIFYGPVDNILWQLSTPLMRLIP